MASTSSLIVFFCIALSVANLPESLAQLNPNYYDHVCPQALPAIKAVVEKAVAREPRMGASLLRLHFHDCFVNGCDGSILLDDTPNFTGEKTGAPNMNSVRGFEVIDQIKAAVDSACGGNVVSCADIVAVAARDSVAALGGPRYDVQVGRRDSTTASLQAANNNIPAPTLDLSGLLSSFNNHGLTLKDLVVLSGSHTLGVARCTTFKNRIYNESSTVNSSYLKVLRSQCPPSGGDNNTSPLDSTPFLFDSVYFKALMGKKGLLHSDQQLFKGSGSGGSDRLVRHYSSNPDKFAEDFGVSMLRMGNLSPLTGSNGEIRKNCRKVNGRS